LRDCLTAAYPPFLIAMAVVGVVGTMESLFSVALLAATPFFFIPRVRFRVSQLKAISFGVLALVALVWIISAILGSSTYNVDIGMAWWMLLACWGLAIADILLQWLGLRNGEQPNLS